MVVGEGEGVGQELHMYIHTYVCVYGTLNRHTDEGHQQHEVLAHGTT